MYREFAFCAWMSWEIVLPLFGVNKSIDNLQGETTKFGWSIAGSVYGLSSACLEASVNHSRPHLSCSVCVRTWGVYHAAPQCAVLLLTQPPSGVSVFLHVESSCLCLLSVDHKQVPPCLTCAGLSCSRFPPVPFGSCSHSAFRQPVVHPEQGLLFFLFEATVFTLTITPLGSFGGWGVHFRLLPFPTYSSEHW